MANLPSGEGAPRLRLTSVRIQNFRALKDVAFDDLSPLTVLFGPNGAGKSTVLDALGFLHDAFVLGVERLIDLRGGLEGSLSAQDQLAGGMTIRVGYQDNSQPGASFEYALTVGMSHERPQIQEERLVQASQGAERVLLDRTPARCIAWDDSDQRSWEVGLADDAELAASTLGGLKSYRDLAHLREWVRSWRQYVLSPDSARTVRPAVPQPHLDADGANLANVVLYLQAAHDCRWDTVLRRFRQFVPLAGDVLAVPAEDERIILRMRDRPFSEPVAATAMSDGSLMILMLLVALETSAEAGLVAFEEPERHLDPRLAVFFAELIRSQTEVASILVTTHSPQFADGTRLDELWLMFRDESGYSQVARASETPPIPQLMAGGGALGDLWMEGFFRAGGPFTYRGA